MTFARPGGRPFGLPGTTALTTAILAAVALSTPSLSAQVAGHGSANYELAARFAPYRIRDLVKSTAVSPRWIEHGDRFWYE